MNVHARRPRVYLAGPTVFLPDSWDIAAAKKALCARHGFEGVYPLDGGLDLSGLSPQQQADAIEEANVALMDGCDLIIADMTPFRGPSMDVGTAFEMKHMEMRGKLVCGYSNTHETYTERSRRFYDLRHPEYQPYTEGTVVENFGMPENLMFMGPILRSGGLFFGSPPVKKGDELRCLANFELGLMQVRRKLDGQFRDPAGLSAAPCR